MSRAFKELAMVSLMAVGLGGCVGTAGVSTWEYRSGPGFETQRVYQSQVQADTLSGISHEACTSIASTQTGTPHGRSGHEVTACDSN
jgi:hypothetical protein